MRGLSALVLLTVAVGAGAGVYYMPESDGDAGAGQRQAAAGTNEQAAIAGARPVAAKDEITTASTNRVFSAQTPLYGRGGAPATQPKTRPARNEQVAEATVISGDPIMRAGSSGVVTPVPGTDPASAGPATREDVARVFAADLHRELKRVGCYSGEISSEWNSASKKAMKAFLERVNAKLPVEQPDHILLTLVKGHGAEACGKGCPAGQASNDDGKCIPRGLLVKAPVKDPVRDTSKVAAVSPEVAPQPAVKAPARVTQSSSWTTEIVPSAADVATPLSRTATAAGTVLPGRMTLGGAASAPVIVPPAPTLAERPKPAPGRLAATTLDTPNAAAGNQPVEPPRQVAPPKQKVRPAATQPDRPQQAPRQVQEPRPPQVIAVPRPQPAPRPSVIVQRSYSGGSSSYVPPTYRPAPSRDWKQTVFEKDGGR